MLVYECSTLLLFIHSYILYTTYIIQIILSLLIVESSLYELRDETKGLTDDKESGYGMLCYDVS